MKKQIRFLFVAAALIAILINACGAVPAGSSVGSDKPLASLVEFTGVIEAIDGNQWTINGQTITVDPSVLRDGPFAVGDTVKVEAEVQADGSVVVTRVEAPAVPTDDNTNAVNSNLDNANLNSNDNTNSNSNANDDDEDDDNSNDDDDEDDDDEDDNSNDDDDDDDEDDNSNSNTNG